MNLEFINLKKVSKFFGIHWFSLLSVAVILLSTFLRFYRYFDRWGLAFDQAHDAILAQYALSYHRIPLLGPFSSAGPFQTGGEWYWFIMLGRLIFPFAIQGPWILLTILQVLFVGLIIYVGYLIGGRRIGLVAGLLAALSPAGIAQAINLTNQSLLNITSGLLIGFAVLYFRSRKDAYLFFMGIFTTLGATIHFQGIPLVIFSFLALVLTKTRSKKGICLFLFGALLPLMPLIYMDFLHKWFNVKNILQYYLHDQYKISLEVLGRRWTTYLDFLWPALWGNVIGGNIYVGYGFLSVGLFLVIKSLIQRNIKRYWALLILPFLAVVILLKNVRTPIFDSYIMFLHPFIFLMSAAILLFFLKKNKYIGFVLIFFVAVIALKKDIVEIRNATNWASVRAQGWTKLLMEKYPNKKFAIYDYKFRSTTQSGPLVMYLQYANKLDDKGYKIGFGLPSKKESVYADTYSRNEITGNVYGFSIIDLNGDVSTFLSEEKWGPINPSYMYNAQEDWYK